MTIDASVTEELKLTQHPAAASTIWWAMLVVALPLAIADIAVAPLMDEIRPHDAASVLVYTCFGLIPAQAALLAIGLVFGDGPLWRRLLIYWVSSLLLTLAWHMGFSYSNGNAIFDRSWRDALCGVCVLPIISLAVQAPLWTIRCFFGWRLVRHDAALAINEGPPPEANLTIRDLMLATAVVAVSLAISRLAPLAEVQQARPQMFWLAVAGFAGSGAGISALGVLPLLAMFFSKLPLGLAWVCGIAYALGYGILLLMFVASGVLGLPIMDTPQIIGMGAVLIAFAGGTAAGLSLLRLKRVSFVRT